MHAVDSALDGLTKSERGVILSGESGVGKTFSARLLHESGTRRGMPFVSFDVMTFFPNGVESELFGSERVAGADNAAFTANHIHQAEGSTLFLHELDSVPIAAQNRLARILQRSEPLRVDRLRSSNRHIRLIATTRQDQRVLAKAGKWSDDLL
jgi:DNA-binding NtrC family response regulator